MAIAETLISRLHARQLEKVILAVSPRGALQFASDRGALAAPFGEDGTGGPSPVIEPDLDKLDLEARDLIPLMRLRTSDLGRCVGPKAAKLGEVYFHYPEAGSDPFTLAPLHPWVIGRPASGRSLRYTRNATTVASTVFSLPE